MEKAFSSNGLRTLLHSDNNRLGALLFVIYYLGDEVVEKFKEKWLKVVGVF